MTFNPKEAVEIISELDRRKRENSLAYFEPYDWQRKFLNGSVKRELARQKALIAANQVGKTKTGGVGAVLHATGLYPDWYTGNRFKQTPIIWVGGNTIQNTRDLVQAELMGEPGDDDAFGTGAIPKHLIGRVTKYHGIPDALQSVMVKHISGKWSKIVFKAFEQGKEAWMGKGVHYVWLDEEPPYDIYSQCLRATLRHSGIIAMTLTPESGMTPLVRKFMEERKRRQMLVTATWDDAPHLDKETKEQILDGLLPYEREMRSKGKPVMGSGLIFPIAEEKIMCDPFPISDEWPRIAGIDFGGVGEDSHPTAMCVFAIDPDTGISYLYDSYREKGRTIPEHWLSMERIGNIPVAWPHDGLVGDRGSGVSYREQYEERGARMLPEKFSNPPAAGQDEGKGGNGVKAGLVQMYSDMKTGQFKVFSSQSEWLEEFRQYYMKPNKAGIPEIVKEKDDLMSASRYGYLSKRFAQVKMETLTSYDPSEVEGSYQDDLVAY